MFAILWAIAWWAVIIIGGVCLGYKTAIFGIFVSLITAVMAAWVVSKIGRDAEVEG